VSSDMSGRAEDSSKVSIWNDPNARGIFFQVILVAVIGYLIWSLVDNTLRNLEARKIASGFGFLGTTASFGINQTLIQYSEESSYGRVFLVGLLNTLLVAGVGVFFATIIGFSVGIMRLSKNWVIAKIATVYVETLRNIPLLLQILFLYIAVLRSVPGKRDKASFFDIIHLNVTGIWAPKPLPQDGFNIVVMALILGLVLTFAISRWSKKRQAETGQQFPVAWTALGLIVGLPIVTYFIMGSPLDWAQPEFRTTGSRLRMGFQLGTGLQIIPEFLALLIALSLYTASFIAEIVRAGILAVSYGQTEAASALGVKNSHTLRLVIIPQAMRVIIPPLTSQYLNLTKNSSLAVAIAYPDLVSVFAGTVLNQTGQAVEIIMMTMGVYLTISIVTSMFMNWYNAKVALVER